MSEPDTQTFAAEARAVAGRVAAEGRGRGAARGRGGALIFVKLHPPTLVRGGGKMNDGLSHGQTRVDFEGWVSFSQRHG